MARQNLLPLARCANTERGIFYYHLAVSTQDLHEFLEVGADYRHWFPRMCEYGFSEGQDFNPVKIDRVQMEGGRMVSRIVDDAAVSIDMAKEICMLQRKEKGKRARQYFLQLEKDRNSPEQELFYFIPRDSLKICKAYLILSDDPSPKGLLRTMIS